MKHTPKPWHRSELSLHGTRLIYGEDGILVADAGRITRRTDEEMNANADLISAAPELLAACKQLLEDESDSAKKRTSKTCNYCGVIHGGEAKTNCPVEMARRAVKKAKGGAS